MRLLILFYCTHTYIVYSRPFAGGRRSDNNDSDRQIFSDRVSSFFLKWFSICVCIIVHRRSSDSGKMNNLWEALQPIYQKQFSYRTLRSVSLNADTLMPMCDGVRLAIGCIRDTRVLSCAFISKFSSAFRGVCWYKSFRISVATSSPSDAYTSLTLNDSHDEDFHFLSSAKCTAKKK